jgi:hypothetical protein
VVERGLLDGLRPCGLGVYYEAKTIQRDHSKRVVVESQSVASASNFLHLVAVIVTAPTIARSPRKFPPISSVLLEAVCGGMLAPGSGIQACLTADIRRKFVRKTGPSDNRRALGNLFLLISSVLLFGLAGRNTAEGAEIQSAPVIFVGPGPQFAIGDFDGDHRPDLVSIEAGQNASGTNSYGIQLHLSAVGRLSIRLVAPTGGLLIEARDVNGDHAVDLVLATAWFRQPAAILLNDGHGSFSRVEPSAFPGAFSGSTTKWASCSDQAVDAVGVLPQSRFGVCSEARTLPHSRPAADSISPSRAGFHLGSFLISPAGRAPPFEVPHF